MKARGHDWTIAVLRNGQPVRSFLAYNSIEIDFGLRVRTVNHVGQKQPRVEGYNDPVTFKCPLDVESAEYVELLDLQRQKNAPNADRSDLRIDVSCSVDFGDGGRSRVLIADCTLHDAGLSVSGRTEVNTSSSPTMTAPTWKRL